MQKIRELVYAALDNARDNGDDHHDQTVKEIVHDLLSYDADLENYSATVLEPFVREWIASRS